MIIAFWLVAFVLGMAAGAFLLAFAQASRAEDHYVRRYARSRDGLARATGRGSW